MTLLSYGPEDDDAAYDVVSDEVKRPNRERWAAMTTDDRVIQTHRVLHAIVRNVDVGFVHRNAELTRIRAQFSAGEISDGDRRRAVEAFEEWKTRSMAFRHKVIDRRERIKHRARHLAGDVALDTARSVLRTLAVAVADHQTAISGQREPTPADRLLWLRLDTLTYPVDQYGGRCVPLADIVNEDTTSVIVARDSGHHVQVESVVPDETTNGA